VWAGAVVALALTRRSGGLLAAAVAVAGLGSSTLVWSATARRRVEFAERDARGLVAADRFTVRLLERFGDALVDSAAAGGLAGGPALLRAYAGSALAPAGFPVALAVWSGTGAAGLGSAPGAGPLLARVATAPWRVDSAALAATLTEAWAAGGPVVRTVGAEVGAATVYAAPVAGGRVLAVTLFPRTRLLPEDPVTALLGQTPLLAGEAPYTLSLLERPRGGPGGVVRPAAGDADSPALGRSRWVREGDELHGDWLLPLPDGRARAHAEVALRPVDVLAPRGALLTLVDLVLAGALWALPALADGALPGARRRWRRALLGSFRVRVTFALFAFFAVPTAAFAIWSYRQLRAGDRQSREALVRETLRSALAEGAGAATPEALAGAAARIGAPLLAYRAGVLVAASEPALVELAPFGRVLAPAVMLRVGEGREVTAEDAPQVGGRAALVGYRVGLGADGERVVLAAPARADDVALGQRRRDLGFLVLLAAVGGGLAALWLSGLAARQLSRPVGALRHAALAIAGGGPTGAGAVAEALDVALGGAPPAEFRPVFGAFRQMAGDLEAGREALEAARRRTAAVLRDVASGVLAVDVDARVTLANPRAEALLGRPLPPGVTLEGRAPAPLTARVRAFVARPAAGGAGPDTPPAADEAEFDVEFGGRQLRARLTRLQGAGDPAGADGGAVLTLDDLTDLTRAERVLAWGEMARQVAHEIKNPLTPIRLGVQLLRRAHRDGRGDFGARLETTSTACSPRSTG
jgi:PAS domain-containing protein